MKTPRTGAKRTTLKPRTSLHGLAPHQWTEEETELFYQWIAQKQCDTEMQIIRLQVRQNNVALSLVIAEGEYCRRQRREPQLGPFIQSRRAKRLSTQWERLDARIRCFRHIERLISPLYYLASVDRSVLPTDDPIALLLWEECKKDYAHLPMFDKEGKL